jgi:D-glycerate 3-kinase|tara:strand:- start:1333 stop:2253 length:921 start_codon:yes stop_codon:yes gene_type:complete
VGASLNFKKLQQQLASAANSDVAFASSKNAGSKITPVGFTDWQLFSSALAPMVVEKGLSVVGICGSQGSGKSTLAEYLVSAISALGVSAVAVSLDDFYLTRAQRSSLAATVHPLLQTRGVPGTHDVALLQQVLETISTINAPEFNNAPRPPVKMNLPSFNKGMDDRNGFSDVAASVLVLEGWCLGVQPQPEHLLDKAVNALEEAEDEDGLWRRWVNQQIQNGYTDLWPHVDYWVQLKAPSFAQVHEWRGEQEARLPKPQRMSWVQLKRFIEHYERLTRWQWQSPNLQPGLNVTLAEDHSVRAVSLS